MVLIYKTPEIKKINGNLKNFLKKSEKLWCQSIEKFNVQRSQFIVGVHGHAPYIWCQSLQQ
jgi:hypothetical protein